MLTFLEGAAGTGKTTQAVSRLVEWLGSGVDPQNVLVLVPQRTLGHPYQLALARLDLPNAYDVQVVTFGGLVQRALGVYWSLVASKALPKWDGREPTYLTVETAQYYMANFVEPALQKGLFEAVSLDRPRLIAQILNNLSAAAVNGFSLEEVEHRLVSAWGGHSSRIPVYRAAVEVARAFRERCLEMALLDFSLQIELFVNYLLKEPVYAENVQETIRYLIVDNAEENFPVAIDFVQQLLPSVEEALIVYDHDAGYRLFLGATPDLAYQLKDACERVERLEKPYGQSPALVSLAGVFDKILRRQHLSPAEFGDPLPAFTKTFRTFYPQMLDWVADSVIQLVEEGVSPREIVVLAPFLNDSLRFTLISRFEAAGIPFISHRPSRAIRDEPIARAVLTCMKLAYPTWQKAPPNAEVARMLVQFIDRLDPIRAELLSQTVYRQRSLGSFDALYRGMQERITYVLGERYEQFRLWLLQMQAEVETVPPDHFIRRLFDFLSQTGYAFHTNLDAGRVVSQLIDSAYHFRDVVALSDDWGQVAVQYIQLVGDGVLAAFHYASWQDEDAVFIAPAYTFLMRNRQVDYQFWVDVGSNAWYERLEQPVTHPYVLRRDFESGRLWTDELEVRAQDEMLCKLLLGLTRRCRKQIFLAFSDLGEQGYEQRGVLLRVFNRILGVYERSQVS